MSESIEHQRIEHDYGPDWCSTCRTAWPCAYMEQAS